MKTLLAAGLGLLGVAVAVHAQEAPTFATGVELVQIEVRATGKDDVPITDLGPGDFVVEEDGERQEIELFHFVSGPGPEAARVEVEERNAPPEADPNLSEFTWLYVAPETRNPTEFALVARKQ